MRVYEIKENEIVDNELGFSWFAGQPEYYHDIKADKAIYQGVYMRKNEFGSDPVPADRFAEYKEFMNSVDAAVANKNN